MSSARSSQGKRTTLKNDSSASDEVSPDAVGVVMVSSKSHMDTIEELLEDLGNEEEPLFFFDFLVFFFFAEPLGVEAFLFDLFAMAFWVGFCD
jgi:hypothetical protein